jgi:hypothetical protein
MSLSGFIHDQGTSFKLAILYLIGDTIRKDFVLSPDTPLYGWGAELPIRGRGLMVCSAPPQVEKHFI